MALINCPDCGHKVSDSATACPSCARPMTEHVQTIERTGKSYKAAELIGVLLFFGGFAGLLGPHATVGLAWLGLITGLLLYVGARIGAWWANG